VKSCGTHEFHPKLGPPASENEIEFPNMGLTFVTGLLIGILVSAAGEYFRRLSERKETQRELLFQVYMMLMELNGIHFWIASSEVRREEPNPEHAKKFHDTGWRIADLLRQIDKLPLAPAILEAMFSLKFPDETQRAQEIERLLESLGEQVNPRYDTAIKKITRDNQNLMMGNLDEFFRRKKKIQP
jgi:H+/gluconate symporter-like permease